MRSTLSTLDLLQPSSLAQALSWMRDEGPLMPVAGGTDVYVALNDGHGFGPRYIDLLRVPELRGVDEREDVLRIGALTTYTELIAAPQVHARLPILVTAAREVGGIQIQNRGTIGGNIANASPAGDTLPVLAAAEAVVHLASASGERRVPFAEFYTGYRATVRQPDELVVAVEIPRLEGVQWFRKVGTRAAQAISKIVMAGVRGERPRIAIGSVAPVVLRLPKTEAHLAGGGDIDEACRLAASEVQPIDDLRSTERYRRRVAANLVRQFWTETAPA
ncbi:FAD binding domain-containing protein [Haliangium ochraceum]|uniref:Molybdopterin dehydrogenase FAD-binding protein n=1 Tax=Haliangium ochraceum (strain DSM 14365 / JCM 11303 / SMP-2) TaxID=502025 RepID=D0LJT7_HALO1|nr:FAD binding domain-containing protein [Haliangium ochraceum]ACY18444.1 molybdopterin dehydrogenase FAD-binding protein [Haliangium ochraceum DSM 14365]